MYIRPTSGLHLGKVATDPHLKTSYSRLMGHKMFVAVLAATLFMLSAATVVLLTAATGGSAADSCTASLPPLVGGGGECSASGGGHLVNEVRQNVSTLLPEVVRCMLPGHTPEYPANSCAELAEQEPNIPSGNYWILNSAQSPVQVFCEMGEVFPASLHVTGGWVRVANLNMTDPDQQCPESLQLPYTDQPLRLCGRRTGGCDSVILNTYGVQYRQVCGRVRGYQFATPDAFNVFTCPAATCTIDNPYVDGVSITHGASPRKHIWTYAAGYQENAHSESTCPCTGSGVSPPPFVGSDYYCESGVNNSPSGTVIYPNDPLWDGQDCNGLEGTCCDPPNLPWFCRELSQSTTDNLEFRICGDQSLADEDTPIDLVELYIQ